MEYLPFGEDFIHEQNATSYYTPYTFSGKERDMETGLSYFGARYYEAGLSIWLSVDPMSDKYPSLSPYNYCAWNPVILIDPDGKQISWPGVTTTFMEFRGAAGAGIGSNFVRRSGVVRDEVGKTHFISQSKGIINSSSKEVMSGVMVSAMGGVSQDWGNETFLGQLGTNGGEFSAGAAYGLSGSFSVGEDRASLSAGLGFGAEVVVGETAIVESISLTYKESDKVNSQSTDGNNNWSLTNKEKQKDGTFKANVSVGVGRGARNTNQEVFSTDGKVWMSKDYKFQAQKVEN
jgi:RHS repeat-associated protein